jgi:hypothetical protein
MRHRAYCPIPGSSYGRILFPWSCCFRFSCLFSRIILINSPSRSADKRTRMACFPGFPFPFCRKEGSAKESVPAIPSCWTGFVNPGTSVWLSRIVPRDRHSDQEVCQGSTYNRKICRVQRSYLAVQQVNSHNGKDINKEGDSWMRIVSICLYPDQQITACPPSALLLQASEVPRMDS